MKGSIIFEGGINEDKNSEGSDDDITQAESEIFDKTVQMLSDKRKVHFKEDYLKFVVLCQLKSNVKKYAISDRKRSQLFGQAMLVQIFVSIMLFAQIYAVKIDEEDEYSIHAPSNFALVCVKIPCIIALHFTLTPQLDNAL